MEHPALTFLSKCFMMIVIVLAPIKAVILTVGFLIFSDLGTGLWAALKRKEEITSAALRRTLSKLIIYQLAVISGFLIEQMILQGEVPLVKVVAGFIGLVEFKSILENSNLILGTDLFKFLIRKIGSNNEE